MSSRSTRTRYRSFLSLIDQLYDTRQKLLSLTAAVVAQDKTVQEAIIGAMERMAGRRTEE